MQTLHPLFNIIGIDMQEIRVEVKVQPRSYRLIIGSHLFGNLAARLKQDPLAARYAIICDTTVAPLWAGKLQKALAEYDLDAEIFTFEAGEAHKTRETKEQLEDQLLKNGYGRDTAILALGGGVVGDVAGYVAATYMRGVPVVQIPTTTLSMADSSIGGKTGVDTPYGKNLIGAFHHPVEVYMDMETLTTLDERNYIAGLAELLKHGFIHDVTILDYVDQHREGIAKRDPMVLEELFRKNCAVKNYVVSMDEQEKGLRQILNYGHTLGHAVEIRSGFKLIHGECVSIGMVFAAELARMKGLCTAEWADLQQSILKKIGLPVDLPAAPEADQLIELMKMDKKVRQGKTLFVLSEEPGRARFGVEVTEEEIRKVLEKSADKA